MGLYKEKLGQPALFQALHMTNVTRKNFHHLCSFFQQKSALPVSRQPGVGSQSCGGVAK